MTIERIKYILTNQSPRAFDRYALAPILFFIGLKYKALPIRVRRLLVAASVYQFMYSYNEYKKLQKDIVKLVKPNGDQNA